MENDGNNLVSEYHQIEADDTDCNANVSQIQVSELSETELCVVRTYLDGCIAAGQLAALSLQQHLRQDDWARSLWLMASISTDDGAGPVVVGACRLAGDPPAQSCCIHAAAGAPCQVLVATILQRYGAPPMFSSLCAGLKHEVEAILNREGFVESFAEPCQLFMLQEGRGSGMADIVERGRRGGTVELAPLRVEHCGAVDNTWKYRSATSLQRVEKMVQRGPTSGVFVQGELVSWALTYDDGAIGMLYTVEKQRGHGYAALAAAALAQQHSQMRVAAPFCFIAHYNDESKRLFDRLGFVPRAEVVWCKFIAKS